MTIQNMIGRAYSTVPSPTMLASWDANENLSAMGFISGYATTVTVAGTTTLTVGSEQNQYFTGTTTQTVVMPVTSTLVLGQSWNIVNLSTDAVTIESSGTDSILVLPATSQTAVTCILVSGTTAASWSTSPLAGGGGVTAAQIQSQAFTYEVDSGTANAYVITPTPAITSLLAGMCFDVMIGGGNSNTGDSTLTVNGLGPSPIRILASTQPAISGQLLQYGIYRFIYDGSNFQAVELDTNWNTGSNYPSVFGGGATDGGQEYTFAWGLNAIATNNGSFVIADNLGTPNTDTAVQQFVASFAGGYSFYQLGTQIFNINSYSLVGGDGSSTNTGMYNFVFGNDTCSNTGNNNLVFGDGCSSTGTNNFVFGTSCNAESSSQFVFGFSAIAIYAGSFVINDSNASNSDTAVQQFVSTFSGGFYNYIATGLAWSIDTNGNEINHFGQADQSYSYQVPTTGFNIAIAAGVRTLTLAPAGTLASGTIDLSSVTPIDAQLVRVNTTQTITTLSFTGATVNNPPTTLVAGHGFDLQYNLANTAWNPLYQSLVSSGSWGINTWSTITAATLAATVANGYVINDISAVCVVTLPPSCNVGDQIRLDGLSTGMGWTATANTGQTIQFGNAASSSGGSWSSTNSTDSCLITCVVANTTWKLSDVVSADLTAT